MKKKVCVLMGGNSSEREVSIWSAQEILNNLDSNRYDFFSVDMPEDLNTSWIYTILNERPNIVLSALHGGLGENGAVQGLLECMGIPYVGSGVMSSAVSLDKNMSKNLLRHHHIPVADDVFIRKNEAVSAYDSKINELGFPLVVKPNRGGSSIGIKIAKNKTELTEAASFIFGLNDDVLIEKYIKGDEVTCGVIEDKQGLTVLKVLDIKPVNGFFDFDSKYKDNLSEIYFSKQPEYLETMIAEIAKKVFQVLECRGYGRVDMIVCEEQIFVLEMNTLPGLTSHSLIPKAADMPFSDFLTKLIEFELS